MRRIALLTLAALVATAVPGIAAPKEVPPGLLKRIHCHDGEDTVKELSIPVDGDLATGKYALPAVKDPRILVVFGHGYGHKSDSWVHHMQDAATAHDVIAVTMDYRGTYVEDGIVRGWFVKEGAADMVAVTKLFQKACPSIQQTVLFGVSMGGNSTGLALAAAAQEKDPAADPLFDYWFDIEGAVNVLETYAGASILAPANAFAARAKADIEREMGDKTAAQDPAGYADLAVVSHVPEIAASGVKGVVLVHAIEDGLVPYNQSREFVPMLVGAGLNVEMFTAGRKANNEGGTTITGYSGNSSSPFAGHASESSTKHIVMITAFERLWSLVDDGVKVERYREFFVDPEAGTLPPR